MNDPQTKWPKLEPVHGSSYCAYSVIENKMVVLYKNQEKILEALKIVYEAVEGMENE